MTTTKIPIFCFDCGAKGSVGQVTAGLQCRCGSTNLGLDGVDNNIAPGLTAEAQAKIAAPHGPGTGWTGPDPRRMDGLNEYAGPTPQVVHRNPPVATENEGTCPVCHGTGRDPVSDRSVCRECGGTGKVPMSPTGGPNPQYGESADPGRALPSGGSHWASRHYANRHPAHLEDGESTSVGDHSIFYHSQQAMGDNNQPARGFTVGTFTVEHPSGRPTEYFHHSPYKPNSWAGQAKSYSADQAVDAVRNCSRCGHKEAGKVKPGSWEDIVRSSTPGYGERGYGGPPAGDEPFDPKNNDTFYPRMPNVSPHVKTREDRNYDAPQGTRPATGYDPGLGYREQNTYRLDMANCPNCGHRPTELVKDKNEDAWWHCPHCGPLANIDKRPEVNPYEPPGGFEPDRTMKTGGFMRRNQKTGRLMAMLTVIHAHNDLNETEALTLARESLLHYGEREGR